MRAVSATELLRLPVRHNKVEVGRPTDLMLDVDGARALGLEVVGRDNGRRFLPLAVATIENDAIVIDSPLVLLDEDELGFYRRRGTMLRTLRGSAVARDGSPAGVVDDVVIGEHGRIVDVVVEGENGGGTLRVPPEELELDGLLAAR